MQRIFHLSSLPVWLDYKANTLTLNKTTTANQNNVIKKLSRTEWSFFVAVYKENIHKDGNEVLIVHAMDYPYIPGSRKFSIT